MIIDAHHHWIPKEHFETLEKYVTRRGELVTRDERGSAHLWRNGIHLTAPGPLFFQIERQVEQMDAAGVDMAVLQLPSWSEWNTTRMAPYINDCCAEIVARYPKRFVGVAHVPLEGKAAVKELERAIRVLRLCGVGTTTHFRDRPLDSERYYGFWEKVAELDIPVVVSPYSYPAETQPFWDLDGRPGYARLENVQRAMIRLVFGTLLERFPNVRILMPHLGGGFFGYLGRVTLAGRSAGNSGAAGPNDIPEAERQKLQQVQRHLAQLYFDTAPPRWRPSEFKCAVETYGEDKMTLGSDYPVFADGLSPAVALVRGADISKSAKEKILGENAAKLFRISS